LKKGEEKEKIDQNINYSRRRDETRKSRTKAITTQGEDKKRNRRTKVTTT
jgi:hypothetical protein